MGGEGRRVWTNLLRVEWIWILSSNRARKDMRGRRDALLQQIFPTFSFFFFIVVSTCSNVFEGVETCYAREQPWLLVPFRFEDRNIEKRKEKDSFRSLFSIQLKIQ